jgi:hypothetical protein
MALVFTVAADTASAQLLFKKIKQRRREELRAEIHAQLSDELTTKMDNDIAREMKIATDTISKAADAKVAVESKKLNQQYSSAVTTLRKESADRFAAESKKLGQQTASGIAAVQKTGLEIADANKAFQASLTAGNSKFQAELTQQFTEFGVAQELAFNAHATSFQEKLDAQLKLNQDQIGRSEVLQTEVAKAIEQMDQTTIDMVTTVDDRLATIDEEIQNEVQKQLPEEEPEPEDEQPAPEVPPAATSSPVKLESDEDDE